MPHRSIPYLSQVTKAPIAALWMSSGALTCCGSELIYRWPVTLLLATMSRKPTGAPVGFRPGDAMQERKQERHERILHAALQVFSRKGYHDTAVDDIAVDSQTSKGGV